MTAIVASRVTALVASSLLLLNPATADSMHHHHNQKIKSKHHKSCKDRPGVPCGLIANDWDCDGFTPEGENYGTSVCRVSCGNCEDVPDNIYTDHHCYPFAQQSIHVNFSNR